MKLSEKLQQFVNTIYEAWRLENIGLDGINLPSNSEMGREAEIFVKEQLILFDDKFEAELTPQSRTPADIVAIKHRGHFWHIALIQVKSTRTKKDAEKLSSDKIEEFERFAKLVKKKFLEASTDILKESKSFVVSMGYAGVKVTVNKGGDLTHQVQSAYMINYYKNQMVTERVEKAKLLAEATHKLGLSK